MMPSVDVLESVRGAIIARDADLADADDALIDVVSGAHAAAREAIRRLTAVRAELDAVRVAARPDDFFDARALARHLLEQNREIITIVTETRAIDRAKTVALQHLCARYTVNDRL